MAAVTLTQQDYSKGITEEIYCIGNSQVAGAGSTNTGGYPFPAIIKSQLHPRMVVNAGIGGQTMQQIACRQGGMPIYVTITGNIFNGTAAVAITSISTPFLSTAADTVKREFPGIICGVPCVVTRSTADAYTIQPCSTSTANIPANSIFYPDFAYNAKCAIQILEMGRNNVGVDLNLLPGIIDSCVSFMSTPRRFLVMGVAYKTSEPNGNANHIAITQVNDIIRANYPNNYIETTPPTTAEMAYTKYNPTSQDLIDISNGIWPQGMMFDDTHGNLYWYPIMANRFMVPITKYNW